MEDLRLEITIERPTAENPFGYIGMVATSLAPLSGKSQICCQDAADGTCTPETLQRVVGDVWSYFQNGQKAFAARIERSGKRPSR